mgnify:CR=1 FL=1
MRHFLYIGSSAVLPFGKHKDGMAHFFHEALIEKGNEICTLADVESGRVGKVDAVLVQDALAGKFQQGWSEKFPDVPCLFVSTNDDISGYPPLWENLFGVFAFTQVDFSLCGIPKEMLVRLSCPVREFADYYFYDPVPKICRMVYFPTGHTVENDRILFDFCRKSNVELTVVSDEYRFLCEALPLSIKVVSPEHARQVLQDAHVVLASGYEALCAMALCKPCIIFGDYGLGGLVTSRNYDLLENISFRGRKGGYFREVIPAKLLEAVVQSVFMTDYVEELRVVQRIIQKRHSWNRFVTTVNETVERLLVLQDANRQKELKPCLSSLVRVEVKEDKSILWRGMVCFGELDDDMAGILQQCDGTLAVDGLTALNGLTDEDAEVLWQNLLALWKEKIIFFKL